MADRPLSLFTNDRPVVENFDDEEFLYRRVSVKEWHAGESQPPLSDGRKRSWASEIPFTPPMSLNRSKFSEPHHVLYAPILSDADAKLLEASSDVESIATARRYFDSYGVMGIRAKNWYKGPELSDGKEFAWTLKHVPEPYNYSHSELWTGINGVFNAVNEPSKRLRVAYRQAMADHGEPFYAPGEAARLYGT